MLYIILAVFISVFLLIPLKLFPVFGIDTLTAIVYNYAFASITGFFFLDLPFSEIYLHQSAWLQISIPLGVLFLAVFYLISLTTQKLSISSAAVANKMSVIFPVLFSVFFLKQDLTILRMFGIVLALVAVYLSTKTQTDTVSRGKKLWLPVLVFIGSGLIDTSLNLANAYYFNNQTQAVLFSICTFASAFVCGITFFIYLILNKKTKLKQVLLPKNILGGLALGIPNFFSIYFTLKSLETSPFSSAQIFPVLNVSNVALSALAGFIIFKEKLSAVNFVGICLALISIILIAL